jgi:DNA-binding transcriptional LysR family regulator
MMSILPELARAYPELDVQLVGSDQLLNVAQGEADLALRNVRPTQGAAEKDAACARGGRLGGGGRGEASRGD